jgi:hypothetical protein
MSGIYHSIVNPNQPYANGTNAHPGGFFEDTSMPLPQGGLYGPVSNVVAASGNANSSYASYGGNQGLQSGGTGYGMSLNQDLLGGNNNRYPIIDSYDSVGTKNELNLDASTQHNPLVAGKNSLLGLSGLSSFMSGGRGNRGKMRAGKRKPKIWGGTSLYSYGYDATKGGESQDLSLFKGSYAPITVTNTNESMHSGSSNPNMSLQLGGKRRGGKKGGKTMRRLRYKSKTKSKNGGRGRSHKHTKYCKHKTRRSRRYRKSRNGSNPLKMTKKILEKIVGGNGTCGGPQVQGQYGGEYSQGYTINDMVTPQMSSLANPMPFKPYNSCQ